MQPSEPAFWRVLFDGTQFALSPAADGAGLASNRVLEEGVETILTHWGDKLLPGAPIHFIGRESALCAEADLFGVDAFGRLHLVEVKSASQATAGQAELFQLLSYLVNRVTTEDALTELYARSLWHGQTGMARALAGLAARTRVTTSRAEDVAKGARHRERVVGALESIAQAARDRSGLATSVERWREYARAEMVRLYGVAHDGPLTDPTADWAAFLAARVALDWKPSAGCVVWLVASDTRPAFEASAPLRARGVDIRCVDLDIREVTPGREWSVVRRLHGERPWEAEDRFLGPLNKVRRAHIASHPDAEKRAEVALRRTLKQGLCGEFEWTGLAGPALIQFTVADGGVTWGWYSHWWTEGQAVKYRAGLNEVGRRLVRQGHAVKLPPLDDSEAFAAAATALVNDAWEHIKKIEADKLDRWATFRAE